MLIHPDNPILHIDGIGHLQWKKGDFSVRPRRYSALAYRIRGDAEISSGEENLSVQSGDVLFLPQNTGYAARYTDTEMIVFHFLTAKDGELPQKIRPQNPEEIFQLFRQALSVWEKKKPGYEMFSASLLYRIFGLLLESEYENDLPPHFLAAVSLLNSRFRQTSLSIREICRETGISETVFRELFRKTYRKTPVAYLTKLRLDAARELISSGISVEEAALSCGFSDPKYFARVVKKTDGCTPRDWKIYGR